MCAWHRGPAGQGDVRPGRLDRTAGFHLRPIAVGLTSLNGGRMLDDDVLSGIINLLMRIDSNVQLLVDVLTEEDDGDEGPDT